MHDSLTIPSQAPFYAIDLFAGGGGASLGIKWAVGVPPVLAVNHDRDAINMHEANHPETIHAKESVWKVQPKVVCEGRQVDLLWLSPDCRHFSKAKGGAKISPRVRTLARVAIPWAKLVRPKVICLENVEEFLTWGPLMRKKDPVTGLLLRSVKLVDHKTGKEKTREIPCEPGYEPTSDELIWVPNPAKAGQYFKRFVKDLEDHGYSVDWRILNAADYGAPTSRKRLFFVARADGQAPRWPKPTHGPKLHKPWRSAGECINWSIPTPSIFDRARPLAEATQRRIAEGFVRFVLNDTKSMDEKVAGWISKYYGTSTGHRLSDPLSTISAQGLHHALCVPKRAQAKGVWLAKHYTGVVGQQLDLPLGTITTVDHHSLCVAREGQESPERLIAWIERYYSSGGHSSSIQKPLPTITTVDRMSLVVARIRASGIVDIGMRMLSPRELARAQGFPDSYILTGSQRSQVARIGNSVSPYPAEAVVRVNTTQEYSLAA